MKTVWIASIAAMLSTAALAQTTIYKLVDDEGHVTYSNRPMKGATVLDLEPLTTISPTPAVLAAKATLSIAGRAPGPDGKTARAGKPPVAIVTALRPSLASVDVGTQKLRDDGRRRILNDELSTEQKSLEQARSALATEQRNPRLVAAVRLAQQASDPTPAQLLRFRQEIDKASGRIRGLQATVAEHEKNIEALRTELGALKP